MKHTVVLFFMGQFTSWNFFKSFPFVKDPKHLSIALVESAEKCMGQKVA